MRRDFVRLVATAQLPLGVVLVARAPAVAAALGSRGDAPPAPWLVRGFGARLLAQALTQVVVGSPRSAVLGAAVDGTHVASMLPLLARPSRYRTAARVSAAYAAGSAIVQLAAARASRHR